MELAVDCGDCEARRRAVAQCSRVVTESVVMGDADAVYTVWRNPGVPVIRAEPGSPILVASRYGMQPSASPRPVIAGRGVMMALSVTARVVTFCVCFRP